MMLKMLQNRYLVLFDALLIILSIAVSFVVRFDTFSISQYFSQFWLFLPLMLAVRLPLFYAFGLYHRLWRYASVNEQVAIAEACALGSALAAIIILWVLVPLGVMAFFARSLLLIEGMLTLLLVGGLRFSFRLSGPTGPRLPEIRTPADRSRRRVLIFGAGDAGAMIVREIRSNPALGLEPVAFLDDDPAKKGLRIHDVPVLGDRGALEQATAAQGVDTAIIAMPTAPGRVVREIAEQCRQKGLPLKTIPGLYEILSGSVKVSAIREVQLDDLLRRAPIKMDLKEIGQYLGGARVLVTGAGGSIGSELCRQIAHFTPQRLVLFELGENNLFQIHRELRTRFPSLSIAPVIADIRDRGKLDCVFGQEQPQIVFHAAAYKHVSLSEENVDEAVQNNIIGTRNVLDACIRYDVRQFVLISTDKAVNPKGVMGACKRVAELLVQDAARRHGRAFVAVRFGNVLGSSGSVVPLFREQIAAGGPVTVTDPAVERYFMTIPEAVSLIIQAAALGDGGKVLVLDMGEPVKICDLAADLIRLSGFEPQRDIDIVFTGLKPGEKLREELFTGQEQRQATRHQQIFVAQSEIHSGDDLQREIAELEVLLGTRDAAQLKAKLKEIVPEYVYLHDPLAAEPAGFPLPPRGNP